MSKTNTYRQQAIQAAADQNARLIAREIGFACAQLENSAIAVKARMDFDAQSLTFIYTDGTTRKVKIDTEKTLSDQINENMLKDLK